MWDRIHFQCHHDATRNIQLPSSSLSGNNVLSTELVLTRHRNAIACIDPNDYSRCICRRGRGRRVEYSRRRRRSARVPSTEQRPACDSFILRLKRLSRCPYSTERRCVNAPTASPWLGQSTAWHPTGETPDRIDILPFADGHYRTAKEALEEGGARTGVWSVGLGKLEIVWTRPKSTSFVFVTGSLRSDRASFLMEIREWRRYCGSHRPCSRCTIRRKTLGRLSMARCTTSRRISHITQVARKNLCEWQGGMEQSYSVRFASIVSWRSN